MTRADQAAALIRQVEGTRLAPYQDSLGIWTYGCGCTQDLDGRPVTAETPPLTGAQVEQLLLRGIAWAGAIVSLHVTRPLLDCQWAALTSFVFNEGPGATGVKDGFVVLRSGAPSTMLRLLNSGDMAGAANQFPLWNKAGGVVLRGLVQRRKLEQALFLGHLSLAKPGATETPQPTQPTPTPATQQTGTNPMSDLMLALNADLWGDAPQVGISVDGGTRQIFTITADRSKGQVQPVHLPGPFTAAEHTVEVTFLNDAYGGSPQTDRNVYLLGGSWSGTFLPCCGSLMSQNQSVSVVIPAASAQGAGEGSAGTKPAPLYSLKNWAGFRNTANGDAASWSNSIPPGGNRTLNGSDEQGWYTDPTQTGEYNPFSVMGGKLIITAKPCAPDPNKANKTYLSGALSSVGFLSPNVGCSIRAMMKMCPGNGWRPAFWLLPSSLAYSGELDVMEAWQGDVAHVHQTVHGMINGTWQTPNDTPGVSPDIVSAEHEYRMDWTKSTITMFVDGVQKGQCATPDGLKEPCFLIFNLGVGAPGSWCGSPDAGAIGTMEVGAVTIYPLAG